eukprot:8052620-Pyramimonas_sp.AAC.1
MDPIVRFMRCKIPPHLGLVRAFADDVGTLAGSLALSLALEVWVVAAGAAGLILHLKKTVIAVHSRPPIAELK